MSNCNTSVDTNPFAAVRIRPGAMPFLSPPGFDFDERIAWFRAQQSRAQIVGLHGSGKTTLLHALADRLRAEGCTICWIELHDGQRRLPREWQSAPCATRDVVMCVDGYEQLGHLARLRLRVICWRKQWGLIVTTHCARSFPTLCELIPSIVFARQVIQRLLSSDTSFDAVKFDTSDLEQILAAHSGNLREVLFDLYDRYERQHRPGA